MKGITFNNIFNRTRGLFVKIDAEDVSMKMAQVREK